jgi:O-antigen ligase
LPEPHVNAHNLLIHALVTTGLLGAIAYLALWWFLARRTTRSILAGDPEGAALMAAAIALFVHAAAEALAYTRAVEALLAAMLAIAATRPQADAVRERPSGRGRNRASSIAASQSQAEQR